MQRLCPDLSDKRWLLDQLVSLSDDPDTQTACLAIDEVTGSVIAFAANSLPAGVVVTPDRTAKPAKYRFVQHAERKLIATCAHEGVRLLGKIVMLNWFPCSDCAGALIDAGVRALICDRSVYEARKDDTRYGFAEAMEMLNEAGVIIDWM